MALSYLSFISTAELGKAIERVMGRKGTKYKIQIKMKRKLSERIKEQREANEIQTVCCLEFYNGFNPFDILKWGNFYFIDLFFLSFEP